MVDCLLLSYKYFIVFCKYTFISKNKRIEGEHENKIDLNLRKLLFSKKSGYRK